MDTLFKEILISLVNNKYVYGGIILSIMLIIYFAYTFNNLTNNANDLNNTTTDNKPSFFSAKNNQILILLSYLFLLLLFYFLYYREQFFDNKLNIFTNDAEKRKINMGLPLYYFFRKVGLILGSLLIFVAIILFVLWGSEHYIVFNIVWNILLVINFISFILGIIYILFFNEINKIINYNTNNLNIIEKILKFALEFIFIIPCLLVILLDIIKHEIKITVPSVWILLIIEIIIILLFFLIPFIFSHLSVHDGKVLVKGPIYIDKQIEIGTYQNVKKNKLYKEKIEEYKFSLLKDKTVNSTYDLSKNKFDESGPKYNIVTELTVDNSYKSKFLFKYNYGISLFLYLNPQPINTSVAYVKDTAIFDYASKPKIVYNGINQELKFICKNSDNLEKTIYTTNDIKFQKWMNIVINYRSGVVDIFIDGTLRATESNLEPFMEYSKIYVGSKNGIAGGIKDITYFNEPLSIYKIQYINTIR
jgi:hypothetical protein